MPALKKLQRRSQEVATLEPLQNPAVAFPPPRDARAIYNDHRLRRAPLAEAHHTEHVCKHTSEIEEFDLSRRPADSRLLEKTPPCDTPLWNVNRAWPNGPTPLSHKLPLEGLSPTAHRRSQRPPLQPPERQQAYV